MRLLLDTHVLLWWLLDDRRMPRPIRAAIAAGEHDVAVSAVSLWEIAIKRAGGRLDIDIDELLASVAHYGFVELPIRFQHSRRLGDLPQHHRDPFDRLLIAQSIAEGRRLVTTDEKILEYVDVRGFDPLTA